MAECGATLDQLSSMIGREHVVRGVDEVSRNDIRRKLEVFCFDCPLHTDDEVARTHGYRLAPAPAAMIPLWTLPAYWSPGEPVLFAPGRGERGGGTRGVFPSIYARSVNAGSEAEFVEPVYPADCLVSVTKLVGVTPKRTRLGEGVFLKTETTVSKQSGEVVLVRRNVNYQYEPTAERERSTREEEKAKSEVQVHEPPPATTDDWQRQLQLRDVKVGDEITPYSLWLSYQRIVMSVAADRMFDGIHHNRDHARRAGLRDIIFNTRGHEMTLEITLRRWIGLAGRLVKFGPYKMMESACPGDTLVCGGQVSSVERVDGMSRVAVDLWIDTARGRAGAGKALVVLPP